MSVKISPADYEAKSKRLPNSLGGCLLYPRRLSRKIYILRHGPIPEGMHVCHTCDQPRCIKDSHHFLGTHTDNMADAARKGRMTPSAESRAKMSKAKMGNQSWLGRKHTAEARAKISKTKMGNQYSLGRKHSAETRAKISKTLLGHKVSAETRAKLSKANLGNQNGIKNKRYETAG